MSTSEERTVRAWAPHYHAGLPLGSAILWVAVAGAVGSVLRVGIGVPFEEHFMKFPWVTLLINFFGSAALGLLAGFAYRWRGLPRWAVPVLGTGLLGSFTTFSAIMVAAVASQQAQLFGEAAGDDVIPPGLWEMLAYLGMGMLFCTAAAAAGIAVGRALFGSPGADSGGIGKVQP